MDNRFKNHLLRIDKLYAFIGKDADGNEGIPAFEGPGGMMIPMVGADMERINQLKPKAQQLALMSGQKFVLVEFSVRTEIEYFHALN